jgi:hypothetical protein
MSGFFLVRPDAVDLDALRPRGFKILLELLVRCRALRRAEVAFVFAPSRRGEQGLGAGRPELPPVALRVALGSRTCSRPAVTGVPAVEPLVPL